MQNHLKDILQELTERGVLFVVCGGVAVVLHGVERMTLDLDIVVDMTRENLQRLIDAMRAQPDAARARSARRFAYT